MLALPDGISIELPEDEDCEEAIKAHHGTIVARQMAKFTAEALPWDPIERTKDV